MKIKRYTVEFWSEDLSCFEWCKYSDVEELQEENARLKKKLKTLAAEASRCRASVYRAGRFSDHERLVNAITAASEEEGRA